MKHRVAGNVIPFVVGLGMIVSSATSTSGFSLLGAVWRSPLVPYLVNAANLDLPRPETEAALRAGADVWSTQANISMRFAFAGQSAQTTITLDYVNLVVFRNASNGSAIATTYTWSDNTGLIDADIVFWDEAFRFFAGTSGCSGGFYIEDIAAHEFGHAIGLGHSTTPGATMYPSVSFCTIEPRSLHADDIAGVLSLYPTGPAPSAPTGLIVR